MARHWAGLVVAAFLLQAVTAAEAGQQQGAGVDGSSGGHLAGAADGRRRLQAAPAAYGTATYGFVTCTADVVLRPTSTKALASAIAKRAASALKQGRPLKIRATHAVFGSMVSFPCASSAATSGPTPLLVGVAMDKMKKVLGVDKTKNQIRVQAGMELEDFLPALTKAGLSMPRSSLPWWGDANIGGVVSASSHGSGLGVDSSLCDVLLNITWVDAAGSIHTSPRASPEGRAICGGVGVLGVVAEVAVQVLPTQDTLVGGVFSRNDANLTAELEDLLQVTPCITTLWRPDIGLYTAHLQSAPPNPNAAVVPTAEVLIVPRISASDGTTFGPLLSAWQSDPFNNVTSVGDSTGCLIAKGLQISTAWAQVPAAKKGGTPTPIYQGVVPSNQLQSFSCGAECLWTNPGLNATGFDIEFAIEKADVPAWIEDVRAIVQKDLLDFYPGPATGPEERCLAPGYFGIRYGTATDSYTAMAAGLKEPAFVEQTMLSSRIASAYPGRYEWVQEIFEQMTLCKYNGRPHWGKNWERTFLHPTCKITARLPNFASLTALQAQYDPSRVFEPALWARMAAGQSYQLTPRCAPEHKCFCEEDVHCAAGFACVASAALPQFKACKPRAMN